MNAWSNYPVLRLLLPFIAGILLFNFTGEQWSIQPVITAGATAAGIVILLILQRLAHQTIILKVLFSAGIIITLLTLGYFFTSIRLPQYSPKHYANKENPDAFVARVVSEPKERTKTYRMVLEVTALKSVDYLKESNGRILTYLKKDSLLNSDIPRYGDVIIFTKHPFSPSKPGNPGEFNYVDYLEHNNIFHQLYLDGGDYKIIDHDKGNPVIAWALDVRSRFITVLRENGLKGKELAVAAAILAGQDDLLDADQRQDYTGAGVIHVLCVSGLHAGIIYILAETIFNLFRRNKKIRIVSPFVILLIIWLYAAVTGLAAPVVRACVMFTFIIAGHVFQRQPKTLNNMAAAAFVMLIFDPGLLFNIGFQLSFGAVAGIIIFQQGIRRIWFPRNKLVGYTWDLITVSLAAQIITAPLAIYHFHQFPNFFIFSNLIAIPLSGIVIYTGLFGALASLIPVAGKIVMGILSAEIKLMNSIVNRIEALPMAVTEDIWLPWYAALILAVALIFIAWWIAENKNSLLLVALGCIAFLLVINIKNEISIHHQQKIVFHKVNGHPAVSFIEGHLQTLLTDSTIVSDVHQADYQLKGFHILNRIEEQHLKSLETPSGTQSRKHISVPEFYNFKGKRLVFLGRSCLLPGSGKQVKVDYVVISRNARIEMAEISHAFPGATIVLDGSNSKQTCERFKREGAVLAMKIYDVKEKGALEVSL